jgi:MFS family permease
MGAGFVVGGRLVQARHAAAAVAFGLTALALGSVGFVAGGSLAVYVVSRLGMGIGSGALWMGVTMGIVERFPGQEYRRLTAVLAAYAVGGIAGPALGGIGGIRGPFAAYLVLTALGACALFAVGVPSERPAFVSDRGVIRLRGFWLASAGILLVSIAVGVVDEPLPLHFAGRLSQAEIGMLYVGASVLLGLSAAVAGRFRPRPLLIVGAVLMVVGIAVAGAADSAALWAVALPVAAIGFGIGEAGAMGILLEGIGIEKIVGAMVAWSQVWAVGYLVGPSLGGAVAEVVGFAALGLVPLAGALVLAGVFARTPRAVATGVRSP